MIKCRQEEKEVRETHQLLLNAEMDWDGGTFCKETEHRNFTV
jgi:hypothetical protein